MTVYIATIPDPFTAILNEEYKVNYSEGRLMLLLKSKFGQSVKNGGNTCLFFQKKFRLIMRPCLSTE